MATKITKSWPLLPCGVFTRFAGTYAADTLEHSIYIDTSWFDGTVLVYFETWLKTSDATKAAYAQLWNLTDGVAIASSEVTTSSTTFALLRSGAITLTSGKRYVIACKNTDPAGPPPPGTTTATGARIIITQSGTITKTATAIPVGCLVSNNTADFPTTDTLTGVTEQGAFISANYDGTLAAYLDAEFVDSRADLAVTVQLRNITDSALVTGSDIATSQTVAGWLMSASFTPTVNKTYKVVSKGANSGAPFFYQAVCTWYSSWIYLLQTGTITKTEDYFALARTVTTNLTTTSTAYAEMLASAGAQYLSTDFADVTLERYLEVSAYMSSASGTGTWELYDLTAAAQKTTTTTTSTAGAVIRSADVALTDSAQLQVNFKTSNASYTAGSLGANLIVYCSISAAPYVPPVGTYLRNLIARNFRFGGT